MLNQTRFIMPGSPCWNMRVKQLMQHRLQSDNRGGGSKSSNSNSYANQADSIGPGGMCNHITWPKTRFLDR